MKLKSLLEAVNDLDGDYSVVKINGLYYECSDGSIYGFIPITNGLIDEVIERFRPPIDRGTPEPWPTEPGDDEEEEHDHG